MKRPFFSKILPLFLLPFPLIGLNQLPKRDFELWVEESLETTLCNISLYFDTEQRFERDASCFNGYFFQFRALYDWNESFRLGPGYRLQYAKALEPSDWIRADVPFFEGHFKIERASLEFVQRARINYVIFSDAANEWLYRHRFLLRFANRGRCSSFFPFVAEEVFFREGVGFSQNRFEVGGRALFGCWGRGELAYMLRNRRPLGEWIYAHVLRIKLDFIF